MAQELVTNNKGLYTLPSELSAVPKGAHSIAKNVNINADDIVTPRRGFDRETYALSTTSDRINKIFEYKSTKIIHYNTNSMARDTGAAYTDYSGTYDPPDSDTPVRTTKANRNLYFTTADGIKRLDSIAGTPVAAGAPRGLSLEGALTGSSGFFTTGNQVAYRMLWGFTDANDNLILGSPSERLVISNSAGAGREVDITVTIPDSVTTSWIYQLYRSPLSGGASVEPSDELQLVYESSPSSGEITAGTLTINDVTPDDLKGATLYTSPSQETITGANASPPFAKDITEFKGFLFYANTKNKHRLQISLLSAEGSSTTPATSLKYDDVITINGVAYTGKSATTVGSNYFKVFDSGTPSQDIDDTARELCRVINQSASNTGDDAIYAYYVSGVNDTPGKFLLESRSVGGAQFSVTFTPQVSGANPWSPELPTSGTTVSSSNDEFKNGCYFSKALQPESVPLSNIFRIGSADNEIKRVLPLRDSLFFLKENGGIFRLSGEDAGSFRVDQFDSTANIIGPETAVVLSNAIYCLSDQGVIQITETGVAVISRPIEDQILTLFRIGESTVASYSYGIAYETERKYILATVNSASDTSAQDYFVYNTFTRAWTKWDGLDTKAALVAESDDKLYFADNDSKYVLKERKDGTNFDYADFNTTLTISSVSADGLTLTLSDSDLLAAGDVIYQSATVFSVIDSVDTVAGTATMKYNGTLVAGSATVYSAIDCHVRWVSLFGGNPGMLKHYREIALLFKKNFSLNASVEFFSEVSGNIEEVPINGPATGLFGFFNFGEIPFGGVAAKAPERTWVPQQKQRCTQLNVGFKHSIGFSDFELNGLSAHFEEISERFAI